MARLRELIYPHVHGTKVDGIGVRPSVEKAVFVSMWNGGRILNLPKLPNYRLQDHAEGEATYYFWSRPDSRFIFFMVDIDVKKSRGLGTREGASDFADYLHREVIPGCHWEPSTNGEGMHGYGLIDLGEDYPFITAAERKDILNRMQSDLRKVALHHGADIELVEVKGSPPVIDSAGIHLARNTHVIRSMVYGTFAKIPRDIEAVAALEPVSLDRLKEIAAEVPGVVLTDRTKKTGGGGSCSGKVVSEEMLAMLPELERVGEGLLAGRELIQGRKVTAYDVACVLLLAWVFNHGSNANADGAMPTRRFEVLWDALYHAGDFSRAWSPNKYKAVRDLLSGEGLIDWIDETFCHGEGGGRACRWRLTAEMAAAIGGLLACQGEGGTSSVNSSLPDLVRVMPRTGRNLRPVRVWAVRTAPRLTRTYLREYSMAA